MNYQNTMVPKLLIVFFVLAILTIDAKRCNRYIKSQKSQMIFTFFLKGLFVCLKFSKKSSIFLKKLY